MLLATKWHLKRRAREMATYYSLVVRENGKWAPQFGDTVRRTVQGELDYHCDSGHKRHNLKIIVTTDSQEAINAAVADLNRRG